MEAREPERGESGKGAKKISKKDNQKVLEMVSAWKIQVKILAKP